MQTGMNFTDQVVLVTGSAYGIGTGNTTEHAAVLLSPEGPVPDPALQSIGATPNGAPPPPNNPLGRLARRPVILERACSLRLLVTRARRGDCRSMRLLTRLVYVPPAPSPKSPTASSG